MAVLSVLCTYIVYTCIYMYVGARHCECTYNNDIVHVYYYICVHT